MKSAPLCNRSTRSSNVQTNPTANALPPLQPRLGPPGDSPGEQDNPIDYESDQDDSSEDMKQSNTEQAGMVDEEEVIGEQSLSQMHGDATPPSPKKKVSFSRLREMALHLVDLSMSGSEELRQYVAGYLAVGIEAIKRNGEVDGMSLQEAANKFVSTQVEVAPLQDHQVFTQEESSVDMESSQSLAITHGTGVIPPTRHTTNPHGRGRKRLKNFIEITREKTKRQRKEKRECTFCGGYDHNITRCGKKLSIGLLIADYGDRQELEQKLVTEDPTHILDKICQTSVKFRIPEGAQSLKILGTGIVQDFPNGPEKVTVCEVYSKGNKFHPAMAVTGPHYITLHACRDFLLSRSKKKFTFVANGSKYEPRSA